MSPLWVRSYPVIANERQASIFSEYLVNGDDEPQPDQSKWDGWYKDYYEANKRRREKIDEQRKRKGAEESLRPESPRNGTHTTAAPRQEE